MMVAVGVAGCGPQKPDMGDVQVNTYKLAASEAQVKTSFSGNIVAQNKVAVHARVTGHVIEKYVKGGQQVTAGQPLFKLDGRAYEADLARAQAGAAQANAAYQNAQKDLSRYQVLADEDAIARKTVDTQASTAEQSRAAYEASAAQVRIAENNLGDTTVYAPFSGTLEMDDIDLGTFVNAGTTTLVTINSTNPVLVEFSMSESEYLAFMKKNEGQSDNDKPLQLQLADGSIYNQEGRLVQASKSLDGGTGKLIMKALFPNPNQMLLPGMYATVISPGDVIKNAMLVPSRAILQVLNKNFIMVLKDDNTVEQVPVTIQGTQGIYTIVTSGVKPGDMIIVDGLTKVKNGMKVQPTELTKDQVEKGK